MHITHRDDLGTTSRLLRLGEPQQEWKLPCGGYLSFPLLLDIQHVDETTKRLDWRVEAHLDLVNGEPAITAIHIVDANGIDPGHMQAFFRWQTPLDVVRVLVPELVRLGKDPFSHDYPIDGYPDAATPNSHPLAPLSDEFLREVANQYRTLGRGYASIIAKQRGVSRRTVVSWIEKARRRGILGKTRPGKFGEENANDGEC
jgi:hypothetical protein